MLLASALIICSFFLIWSYKKATIFSRETAGFQVTGNTTNGQTDTITSYGATKIEYRALNKLVVYGALSAAHCSVQRLHVSGATDLKNCSVQVAVVEGALSAHHSSIMKAHLSGSLYFDYVTGETLELVGNGHIENSTYESIEAYTCHLIAVNSHIKKITIKAQDKEALIELLDKTYVDQIIFADYPGIVQVDASIKKLPHVTNGKIERISQQD